MIEAVPTAATSSQLGRGPKVRTAVLAATLAELTASGYAALTVDNVARRAGVHKTTLYRRWKDRQSLVVDALTENVAVGVPIPNTGDLRADLRLHARSLVDWLTSPLGRAVLAATLSDAARISEIAEVERRFYDDRLRRAEPIVTRAIERGQLDPDTDPSEVIKTLIAPIYLRLLITAEPITAATADQAASVALAAAQAGVLRASSPLETAPSSDLQPAPPESRCGQEVAVILENRH
jgi:AcrR family transcriptional regulator